MEQNILNDEEEFDRGFVEMPMYDQLGKIIDSVSAAEVFKPDGRVKDYFRHFRPVNSVVTDDGFEVNVTVEQAAAVRKAILGVRTQNRLDVLKQIQYKDGLNIILNFVAAEAA